MKINSCNLFKLAYAYFTLQVGSLLNNFDIYMYVHVLTSKLPLMQSFIPYLIFYQIKDQIFLNLTDY